MFSRIAIVNRGEAAMRLIHAVRDLNAAHGFGPGDERRARVVALHTEAERAAMFVREADIAYDLGPASERPYLNHDLLARALRETGADAAWVGWGFVAEDPAFADLCARIGVTFIGPSAEAMRKLGDKIGSKLIAEEVGVPVAPWSRGEVATLEEAQRAAAEIGYPLMLKATAGGGGRGIRKVSSDEELAAAYQLTRDEALRAFGNGAVFLERLVTGARHVEVQVIADGQGTAWAIGVRDCSIQRRNQKVIEESASPLLDADQVEHLKSSAERLAVAVGYSGAATVEFLYHPGERLAAFLEVNTRLQVEHPITEVVTGTDLVRLQIHVAGGGRLEGERPAEIGHAVEARLNAEDPDRDFAPAPGRIKLLDLPAGPGVRVDTGVGEGDEIPADFDSMIAKVIAYGRTRDEALARLRRAMQETTVVIEGGATNKSFVLDLLDQPEVTGDWPDGTPAEERVWADTGWIDRVRPEGRLMPARGAGVALVAAAMEAYADEEAIERARLIETARGGRPQVLHAAGAPINLALRGVSYSLTVLRIGPGRFRVSVSGGGTDTTVEAVGIKLGEHVRRLRVGDRTHRVIIASHGPVRLVEVDEIAHRVTADEGGVLRSPAPALVVATPVGVGGEVATGAPAIVLESMKMETVIPAPFPGRVKELLVSAGSQVETGAPLMRLEPLDDGQEEQAPQAVEDVDLELPPDVEDNGSAVDRIRHGRAAMTAMLLGYDVDESNAARRLQSYLAARDELGSEGLTPLRDEVALLEIFSDFAELGRNRPAGGDEHVEHRIHSPREHFHTYLRSLDADRGALPGSFRSKLSRVLTHYGVTSLDQSPQLEEAVFRVFLAGQRSRAEVQVVQAILGRWLAEDVPPEPVATDVREILDRLVVATQLRFPALGDLARSVRFRWFDQPSVETDRTLVLGEVEGEIEAIAGLPAGAERHERMDRLAAIPERIVGFLGQRLVAGVPAREPMLAVLVKRHYLEYELAGMTETDEPRPMVVADYVIDDRPSHLVSTLGHVDELTADSDLARAVSEALATAPEGHGGVVDLYVHWADEPSDPDDAAAELAERVALLPFAQGVRRIAVGVVPGASGDVGYFTFRPEPGGGVVEDDLVRGVHPMVGRRLNLWRLRDFELTRLDAPKDVLLLLCVAPDNPSDARLIALAQVRQFVVARDADGAITSLPHAERAIANCLQAIRSARGTLGSKVRSLDMNEVWLHIWPPIEADLDQLTALRGSIAPMTAGAGIEELRAEGRVAVGGAITPIVARFSWTPGQGVITRVEEPTRELLKPLDDYDQKVLRARRRGLVYPYELAAMITGAGGDVQELDLDDSSPTPRLVPVDRPYGLNKAGIICALASTPRPRHPQGVRRVVLAGDPLKSLGSVAEPECTRIIAALDLAEEQGLPVEWFSLSAGARIAMDSGVENMDWIARALKRIVQFTQTGGEINIVVAGINVGAQPYWNAEATMLMHTKGVLIMTPDSAMVLTGKQSLDFSGGVSAEDNFGIGGYDRVMGPNGQAQYWAPDLRTAASILMRHYEHTYIEPGESAPRPLESSDPVDRDVTTFPHNPVDSGFTTVGDIFSMQTNPDRKKAFDIRTLMRAVSDQDSDMLERWAGMADAETSVVVDTHLGGQPVCLIGIESKPVPRRGFPPTDGPDTYTAGTLFPRSSKKTARAINSASGNRPVVVLANLSGFDGSPESMRELQLEYGAEIGRAIVNFDGPIVFVVISRYHGGAFVVFSKALNPRMRALAVEGSFASVIGGAPAAAVVFARDVDARVGADQRIVDLQQRIAEAPDDERARLVAELEDLRTAVRAEVIGQVASEFDGIHSIHRAVEMGSVDEVISASELRPKIIESLRTA